MPAGGHVVEGETMRMEPIGETQVEKVVRSKWINQLHPESDLIIEKSWTQNKSKYRTSESLY